MLAKEKEAKHKENVESFIWRPKGKQFPLSDSDTQQISLHHFCFFVSI